jgi:tagatose 1,6-diphosphate aldolase
MTADIFKKNGAFLMLALDHDESFRKMINPADPKPVSLDEVINLKKDILTPLVHHMSGILLDSEYGLPAYSAIAEVGKPPFLLRLEKSGYEGVETERYTKIAYSSAQLKERGAQGVKLLLYFNPYSPSRDAQTKVALDACLDARSAGLPIFVEIVTYNIPGEVVPRSSLILSSLHTLTKAGVVPDVWKLEFPDDKPSVCAEITSHVGTTPWILLTRGVTFEVFKEQMKKGKASGAVGFLAGRALWQEVGSYKGEERMHFLSETLPSRFKELAVLAS